MRSISISILVALFLASAAYAQSAPNTIVLDGTVLQNRLAEYKKNRTGDLANTVGQLVLKADKLIKNGKTYSVIDKSQTPPSGDKHDYMSQAPYWWPDPSKPNGLPYIKRDGERNPELSRISDSSEMDKMVADAELLSLAYFFTKDEKYAKQAAVLIRAWFLDEKTKQNPNLNFGQGIPGITKGRGIGLIETRDLYRVIDASILLDGSRSWSSTDRDGLKKWFSDFLRWMTESPIGKDEADEENNHGTHYDVQVIAYAIYTGQKNLALKQLEVTKQRIASQIEPDGRQPRELARTLSWGYTNMNLYGFFTLARLGESVGVDLWNYKTSDGRSIKQAFEWLLPFAGDDKKWTYQQIKPRGYELTSRLLNIASVKYKSAEYSAKAKSIEPQTDDAVRSITNY